jgi:hypothetical protein
VTDAKRDVRLRMEEFIKHVEDARIITTGKAESLEMRDAFTEAVGGNSGLHADKYMCVHADKLMSVHADPHLVCLYADKLLSMI